jgi:hypothetical protein
MTALSRSAESRPQIYFVWPLSEKRVVAWPRQMVGQSILLDERGCSGVG